MQLMEITSIKEDKILKWDGDVAVREHRYVSQAENPALTSRPP